MYRDAKAIHLKLDELIRSVKTARNQLLDLEDMSDDELDKLLTTGIHRISREIPITYYGNECEAVEKALQNRKPKMLLVVLSENIQAVTECILKYKREEELEMVNLKAAV